MSAIELHARASADFNAKLAATRVALQHLVQDHSRATGAASAPVVQASSLGAEDVVVSHLINALALDVGRSRGRAGCNGAGRSRTVGSGGLGGGSSSDERRRARGTQRGIGWHTL